MVSFYSSSSQVPYPDSSVQGSALYATNYSSSGPYLEPQQNYVQLPTSSATNSQGSFIQEPYNNASHFGDHSYVTEDFIQSSHLGILNGQKLSLEQTKGLSLSLSTQIPAVPSFEYRSALGDNGSYQDDKPGLTFMSSLQNSKYLNAAKQLLDEVASVQDALKQKLDRSSKKIDGLLKSEPEQSNPQEKDAVNSSTELSASERQELQDKVAKLAAMLGEVDRRYKQYYHQMQIVVSCFDAVAGSGSARPYTALALQTISRHFRCLRDAITSQMKLTQQKLGEKESTDGQGVKISRLRYIDQQIRQQRAMQQFGLMQPHIWRPQRGLPENSVSILRAWLFEHFLHPYPKDSEKLMLARQAGLTRGQVANWFINARVRLWKPMIEEMYKEEFGDTDTDFNTSSRNPSSAKEEPKYSAEEGEDPQKSGAAAEMCETTTSYNLNDDKSNAISYVNLSMGQLRTNGEDYGLLQQVLSHQDGNERLMSLTLGLQNPEGGLPMTNAHSNFMTVRGEDMYGSDPMARGNYEYTNEENQPRQFVPSHLMHDFVA